MKKSMKSKTASRKGAKTQRSAKRIKEIPFAFLGALAPLREDVDFFTASKRWEPSATNPISPGGAKERAVADQNSLSRLRPLTFLSSLPFQWLTPWATLSRPSGAMNIAQVQLKLAHTKLGPTRFQPPQFDAYMPAGCSRGRRASIGGRGGNAACGSVWYQ